MREQHGNDGRGEVIAEDLLSSVEIERWTDADAYFVANESVNERNDEKEKRGETVTEIAIGDESVENVEKIQSQDGWKELSSVFCADERSWIRSDLESEGNENENEKGNVNENKSPFSA